MRVRRAVLAVAWTGVALVDAQLGSAQEATSANLPDQFQTGEMIQIQKSKKKRANSQDPAAAPNQNTAPVPDQSLGAEELPPLIVPSAGKKSEPTPVPATMASRATPPSHPIEQPVSPEESPPAIAPITKSRPKKRAPHVESEVAGVSEPVPMSLSVAQSMAISAPLPEYPYEAKRRNLAGNGVCVVTVDVATGRVSDSRMSQSTGSTMLDKLTIQTFKTWRFKPGTVSEVRVPISYE